MSHFHLIRQKDKDLDREEKMVFDCGGFVDLKIPALVQASDLGVVPVSFQSMADLKAFFVTLEALAKLNPNILIVINNTKTAKIAEIENGLQEILKGKYPVKVVKQSAYMTYLANEGKTPFELTEMGVTAKALATIQSQLTELFNFITRY